MTGVSTKPGPLGAGRFIGAPVLRREDARLLTGKGSYVDDIALPGMLHAVFVRSPLARARIRSVDVSQALALPGVVTVWTGETTDEMPVMPLSMETGSAMPEMRPLARGDVRFVGDPVAVVVAEDRYIAEDASELVDVVYDPLPAVVEYEGAAEPDSDTVHSDLDSNIAWEGGSPGADAVEARFEDVAHEFVETLHQHRHTNVPMETRGVVASWDFSGEELTVWLAGQNPHNARMYYAKVLDVPENQVRIIMRDVGGGFGGKAFFNRDEICVALLSRRLGTPVKWIEDRQENLTASNQAREEMMTVRFGFSKDAQLEVATVRHVVDAGSYPLLPPETTPHLATLMFPGPYRLPHYAWTGRSVYTNTCGLGAYRGPWMMETTAREVAMDLAARDLGIDPAELRRRNVLLPEDLPYTSASGALYEHISPAATLEQALELAEYEQFRSTQEEMRRQGRYVGIGISMYVEPTALGGGIPLGIEAATVRIEPSGMVTVLMGTGSHGHSIETTMVQVVAEHLGVRIDDVVLHQGDTRVAPVGGGTGASRTAVVAGGVARVSALKLREKVVEIAAHLLEASPQDLEVVEGIISVKGSPDHSITVAETARVAYLEANSLPEGMEPGLENTSRYSAPPATHSNATHVCICEVDIETGAVKVLDYVVSEDCGVMINPMVVEGQIAGGVVQGIGGVLLEHMAYDDDGNPLATNFKDYVIPTTDTVPTIRYGHVETPSNTPGGHKGVGEGGAIGAPAAVINSVADALAPLGVRIIRQPLGPENILNLIESARNGG